MAQLETGGRNLGHRGIIHRLMKSIESNESGVLEYWMRELLE